MGGRQTQASDRESAVVDRGFFVLGSVLAAFFLLLLFFVGGVVAARS